MSFMRYNVSDLPVGHVAPNDDSVLVRSQREGGQCTITMIRREIIRVKGSEFRITYHYYYYYCYTVDARLTCWLDCRTMFNTVESVRNTRVRYGSIIRVLLLLKYGQSDKGFSKRNVPDAFQEPNSSVHQIYVCAYI